MYQVLSDISFGSTLGLVVEPDDRARVASASGKPWNIVTCLFITLDEYMNFRRKENRHHHAPVITIFVYHVVYINVSHRLYGDSYDDYARLRGPRHTFGGD